MNVLGIDVSTSITGFAIQNDNYDLLHNSHVNTKNKNKFPTIYHKADAIQKHQESLDKQFEIGYVYLEQRLLQTRPGQSSAHTMAKQCEFNGMVSMLCHQIFPSIPQHVHASTARKGMSKIVFGEEMKKSKKKEGKRRAMQFVLDNYPNFVQEYTSKGNIRDHCWDKSDAIVIARCGVKLELEKMNENC